MFKPSSHGVQLLQFLVYGSKFLTSHPVNMQLASKSTNYFCLLHLLLHVVSVSIYLGTTISKLQIMPQKTNHIRTVFISFPGHLK